MTIDNKDGAAFLAYVTDKLETRIAHISQSILEGQKDIEGMHEYYWENYTEMDQYGYENYDNPAGTSSPDQRQRAADPSAKKIS